MEPITMQLPELSDGVMIIVQGTVKKDEDGKCILDFGHSMKTIGALHMCVTFASQVELSLQLAEENGFSFRRGFVRTGVLRFEVILLVSDGNFKISLNGCHVCEAPYVNSLKGINRLEVNGNILLHRIFCQRPCHAGQQVNGDNKASKKVPDMFEIFLHTASKQSISEIIASSNPPHVGKASAETDLSERSKQIQESKVTEVGLSAQHSDVDLSDVYLKSGLSADDSPKSGTNALYAACWSTQNPSIPGRSEQPGSCKESEALATLTTSDRFEPPHAYPSPQNPAVHVSSAEPQHLIGRGLAQCPVMPDRLDAPYPPSQYVQPQNPVMVDQSKPHCPYPLGNMPNQNGEMHGNSNMPCPYPGYAYQQNPCIPGQWNAPYILPGNASNQNPVATCQSNAPLPAYPYPGYTPNSYPPSGPVAPYYHPGYETQQQNAGMPSHGAHPAFNPFYSAPWPNYNQQPGTDAMPTPNNWNHSNMKYFPEGLRLNQVINIYGEFLQNSSGCSVLVSNGETEIANVFLNMVVSFPDRMVSRSSKLYSQWSQIESSLSHFPFQAAKPFHIAIVCCYNLFRVYGNETHLFDFQALTKLPEINVVKVVGMVASVNIVVS